MKLLLRAVLALSVVGIVSDYSFAVIDDFSIRVTPAFAPKGTESPSWDEYVENAIDALRADADHVGHRDSHPTAYEAVTEPIPPLEMIYTDFNSWRSTADPSETFTSRDSVFQGEFGNRIHFGLQIASDGARSFALQDLSWALDSDDNTDYFDQDGTFANANYSSTRVGVNYGADGVAGGGDDIVYDDGEAGSLAIHELTYVGVGDGFLSREPSPANDNADIDQTLRDLLESCERCSFNLTGIYTINDPTGGTPLIGTGSVEVFIEPGYGSDFNRNFVLDSGDLDMLTQQISVDSTDILFDLDKNKHVRFRDLQIAVKNLHNTWFGDANDDGEFNSGDLVDVFVAGLYDTNAPAVWSTGDWNGDGKFTSGDLIVAFQDGGYERGPRSTTVVPEPSAACLALLGLLALFAARRK